MTWGYSFNLIANITDTEKADYSGFQVPFTLDEGIPHTLELEFVHPRIDDIQFVSK